MLKVYFVLFLVCVASFAMAAPVKAPATLEKSVLRDMNAILSDTYNESDGTAEATHAECSIVKKNSKGMVAFCSIEFLVQPDADQDYKTTHVCTSMGYKVSAAGKSIDNFTGWEECIDGIGSITEN